VKLIFKKTPRETADCLAPFDFSYWRTIRFSFPGRINLPVDFPFWPCRGIRMPALLESPRTSAAKTSYFSHQVLSSLEEIESQCPDRDLLVDAEYDGNPLLSMDWHINWLHVFAPEISKICYVRIQIGSDPIAYFPLLVRKGKYHAIPVRFLACAGHSYCPVNCSLIGRDALAWATEHLISRVLPKLGWDVFLAGIYRKRTPASTLWNRS